MPRTAARISLKLLLPLTLLAALVVADAPAGSTEQGIPVPNSLQQIYRPGVGQGDLSQPLTQEELDRYLVPPLVLQGTNIGQTAAEPTIGVQKDGTAFYAASTLVVDTAFVWGVAETDVHRSLDGGLTWESVQLKAPATNDSIIPGNADPFVYVDQATGRIFNIDLYGACSWLNISDDKGESWTPSPLACGNPVNDHHTIAAGPPPEGVTTLLDYPNVLYYCFNRIVDAACGRSIDGGLTWTPTGAPHVPPTNNNSCSKLHGHIRTDSEGRLFVPLGNCGGDPWVAVSDDAGDSWSRYEVSDINSSGTHTSLAVDTEDNVYYVWWGPDRLPYVAYSTDHGATWSEAFQVGPPGVTESNFPTIAAGEPGHIVVNFPSSTDEDRAGATRPWNQTVTVTYNLLEEDPIFHSATGNDPADPIHRGNCNGRCGGLWDFLDVTIAPASGEAWAAASDDCIGPCRNGVGTAAKVGDGLAIRQIGGPCLITPANPDEALCDPVPEVRWLPEEEPAP